MRYTRAQIVNGTGFDPDARFEQVEDYNGWTNRETWAVALYINNDQGWQESVLEAVRNIDTAAPYGAGDYDAYDHKGVLTNRAGEAVRESVEEWLDPNSEYAQVTDTETLRALWALSQDIGSLWRVAWDELGAAFLNDAEVTA